MIFAFFKFILIVFICVFIIAVFAAARILSTFRNFSGRFKNTRSNMGGSTRHRQTYTNATDKETVIDRRSPDKANKKIFSKNEGEYVDFEEE